jgi:hypothetical protein
VNSCNVFRLQRSSWLNPMHPCFQSSLNGLEVPVTVTHETTSTCVHHPLLIKDDEHVTHLFVCSRSSLPVFSYTHVFMQVARGQSRHQPVKMTSRTMFRKGSVERGPHHRPVGNRSAKVKGARRGRLLSETLVASTRQVIHLSFLLYPLLIKDDAQALRSVALCAERQLGRGQ